MRYNHIQRLLSAALLLAFTAPSGITSPAYSAYSSTTNDVNMTSLSLSSDVALSKSNEKN